MDNAIIDGTTPALQAFLAEWRSPTPFILANTSGSTGKPKTIRLARRDVAISAMSTCRRFGLDCNSVVGLPLSVDYIAGKMMVVRAIMAGCRMVVEEPSAHPFATLPSDVVIDLASIVPPQIDGLLDACRCKVRRLLVGGAPMSATDEGRLIESGIEAYATYGMTETCSNVALRRVGTDCYVANSGFNFSIDERGCLVIRSQAMSFGSLVTNDVVELLDPLTFRWLGRADNIINSGGVKVNPEVVEAQIARFVAADHFYVTSRASERWGMEVIAIVEHGFEPTAEVQAHLATLLPKAHNPKAWIVTDRLERTPNGKLKRNKR